MYENTVNFFKNFIIPGPKSKKNISRHIMIIITKNTRAILGKIKKDINKVRIGPGQAVNFVGGPSSSHTHTHIWRIYLTARWNVLKAVRLTNVKWEFLMPFARKFFRLHWEGNFLRVLRRGTTSGIKVYISLPCKTTSYLLCVPWQKRDFVLIKKT